MPAHHLLEHYLDVYVAAAGIGADKTSPLFRTLGGRGRKQLSHARMARQDYDSLMPRHNGRSFIACMFALLLFGSPLNGDSRSEPEKVVENDDITTSKIETLGARGADGVPELLRIMKEGTEAQRVYAGIVLGKMGLNARGAIPDLKEIVLNDEGFAGIAAAQALVGIGRDGVTQLLSVLDASPGPGARQRVAVGLGAVTGDSQPLAAEQLGRLLRDQPEDVRRQAELSLKSLGPAALKTIREAMRDPDASVRAYAASAAEDPKFSQLVPDLIDLLHDKKPDVVTAAAFALGQIGASARAALSPLVDVAKDNDEARTAVTRIAEALADQGQTDAISELQAAKVRLDALFVGHDDESDELARGISRLENLWQFWLVRYELAGVGFILGFVLLIFLSWRLRRWLRISLGQRWTFELGECDQIARVTHDGDGRRIAIIPRAAGQAAVFEDRIAAPVWPLPAKLLSTVRERIGSHATVRVEVDLSDFGRPWSIAVAGPWTDGTLRNVAGQVCLTANLPLGNNLHVRNVVFRGLAVSGTDRVHDPLPMAGPEVEAVGNRFRTWGATVDVFVEGVNRSQFVQALRESDVVHLAAHAAFDRLFLADGPFTADDLTALNLSQCRCRLLVLSACEVGSMDNPAALLWSFVLAGINVIAASRPAYDHICRVFFGELYSALLPTRRAAGIELGEAIRLAIDTSRRRIAALPDFLDDTKGSMFDDTVGSFMLFGDPSLSLNLSYPRRRLP